MITKKPIEIITTIIMIITAIISIMITTIISIITTIISKIITIIIKTIITIIIALLLPYGMCYGQLCDASATQLHWQMTLLEHVIFTISGARKTHIYVKWNCQLAKLIYAMFSTSWPFQCGHVGKHFWNMPTQRTMKP